MKRKQIKDKTPQILVVDDSTDWRMTIFGLLCDENYDVKVAESSSKAIELLEKNQFDVAILDVRLDETDEDNTEGLDLAKTIQQCSPDTKVIILTGYSTLEVKALAMTPNTYGQSLVEDFIEKRESEALLPSIRKLLEQ